MADAKTNIEAAEKVQGRRKEVVGEVVSSRMSKTIVVKVTRKLRWQLYDRLSLGGLSPRPSMMAGPLVSMPRPHWAMSLW